MSKTVFEVRFEPTFPLTMSPPLFCLLSPTLDLPAHNSTRYISVNHRHLCPGSHKPNVRTAQHPIITQAPFFLVGLWASDQASSREHLRLGHTVLLFLR